MTPSSSAVGRAVASVPLWAKLTAALLALATLGLLATGIAGTTALDRYLVNRVDDQLQGFTASVQGRVSAQQNAGGFASATDGQIRLPSAFYGELRAADGSVTSSARPPDALPGSLPVLPNITAQTAREMSDEPFTVDAMSGARDAWRVSVEPLSTGGTLVVAASLDDVNHTVSRLRAINVVVGCVVLLLLALCAYLVVRISLRPLAEVEETAEAFAQGDLSQRVPDGPPGTEVGRLTNALNGMLTQIETAFRAREESEAAARASEERMRRFVADASHELRTPLTSIRGFAELYRQGSAAGAIDADEADRMMKRIEQEATRMGLLVEDLLLLARLDEARPLEQGDVDLLVIAADAVASTRALDPDRPVTLEVLGDDAVGPPLVVGDDARLRQVVANLTSNALAHTPEGTPVTVRVGTVDDADGRWAFIEVADRGPGLTPEQRERVFERFYRAESSRSRSWSSLSGSGLGLSIVAALVAAHSGHVRVDSEPGEGAAFRVLIPRAVVTDTAAEPETARS